MKKFLIVINSLSVGGAERLVVDQVNFLEKSGYHVDVLTILPRIRVSFYDSLNFVNGKLINLNTNGFSIKNILSIRRVIMNGNYNVIISHLFLANTLTRIAKALSFSDAKMISYEHNVYSKEKKSRHIFIDLILSFITYKIIAVSDEVRNYLIKNNISESKIVTIPNGISDDFTKKSFDSGKTREDIGIKKDDFMIVSIGNVNPQKGYEILVRASAIITQQHPNIHFVICGSDIGQYAENLKKESKKLKVENNVHFLGSRLDAIDIMQSADVFLMTSHWEGLSISLLEALMLGKIIIVSEIPSLLALIKEDKNGSTFTQNNPKQLSEILSLIHENKEKYMKYSNEAKLTGREYSIETNINKLLAVIK